MSRNWDTSSLVAMERTAGQEADGVCSLKCAGRWLEVRALVLEPGFTYTWGGRGVSRVFAENYVAEENKK